jgi:hypothetical protein
MSFQSLIHGKIKKMKVKDLKRECLRRKLSIKRNKSELATRLEENGFEISIDLLAIVSILGNLLQKEEN